MPSSHLLWTLAGVWGLGLVAPGPDFFLITHRGIARGFRHALAAAAGVIAGIEIWIISSLIGLSVLFRTFPQIRIGLSLIGGGYLLYLGVVTLRDTARSPRTSEPDATSAAVQVREDFLAGIMTNLGNPKALVFFGALLVRFVPENSGYETLLPVWLVMTVMATVWFSAVALCVSRPSLQRALAARLSWINALAGVVFCVLGIVMIGDGVRS